MDRDPDSSSSRATGDVQQPDPVLLEGYAQGCTPPNLQSWPVGPPRVPALQPGQKPNFIVILVDDQGYDDIGLHHPRGPDGVSSAGAQTPNLDKLMKGGMSFSNFYASPLCAISRAALLTGRDAVRTGNLFNGFGYDSFSLKEATMGDVMQQAGYVTAHYGKWHNGRAQGYEPWNRGFNDSWLPDDYVHVDNLMRHNGKYAPTKGLMEQALLNRMIGFMQEREADGTPFLTYYAPFAIHRRPPSKGGAPSDMDSAYFSPSPYLQLIQEKVPAAEPWNARLWAMLMYFDEILGQLADYVDQSPQLRGNTYILIAGDNGPALPSKVDNNALNRLRRMPSGMIGDKNSFIDDASIRSSGTEGSLRNHLTVWGPGVPSGAVSGVLLTLSDILPTLAELANATDTKHMPWSGQSFANLLAPTAEPTPQQQSRFLFTFVASGAEGQCPQVDRLMTELLPDLDAEREVMRPQPLLAYRDPTGRSIMKNCIVGRFKDFKWYGSTDKVFRLANGSHIELPCNEVTGEALGRLNLLFNQAARQWWDSVVAEPDSFTKPVYYIGQSGSLASNVEANGAIALTRGDINMTSTVVFSGLGYVCYAVNIVTRGMYSITAMYNSRFRGPRPQFILAVGEWKDIVAGTAPSLTNTLGHKGGPSGSRLGTMFLEKSNGTRTERSSRSRMCRMEAASDAPSCLMLPHAALKLPYLARQRSSGSRASRI
ncbi:hypothetical protein OEZ85_009862 [Tetradesmus obliquus]|uniref:Sulfatase N-terminal domain-containing protein n=1 Tax=Tetradesmus obliquus TaxID=3088 RepID=A0ABY8UAB6_TETOB|nr:hypothetical protein OEZ85_009862 [Tetradesmus obliquus]